MTTALKFPFGDEPKPPIKENLLAQLPNGMTLKWCPPKQSIPNDAFPFDELTEKLLDDVDYGEQRIEKASGDSEVIKMAKACFPKLNAQPLLSTQKVVIADFDKLPKELGFENWNSFYDFMVMAYGDVGVVARSIQNKVKVFFVIDFKYSFMHSFEATSTSFNIGEVKEKFGPPLCPTPDTQDCLKFLEHILKDDSLCLDDEDRRIRDIKNKLFDLIDKKKTAMATTLISSDMLCKLKYIRHCRVFPFSAGEYRPIEQVQEVQVKKSDRLYEGELPKESLFFVKGKRPDSTSKEREKFMRYLLDSSMLIDPRGYNLSTTVLKRVTNVSKRTISKWIKELCDNQVLECIDPKYINGAKAKTYIAHSWLREFIEVYRPPSTKELDREYPDEQWDKLGYFNLLRLVGGLVRRPNQEIWHEVETYIHSLPRLHDKQDRLPRLLRQAEWIMEHRLPKWRSKL